METKKYLMEDALDEIIDYRGKTPKKSETGIMTLSAKSVKNGYIDYSQCYYISQSEYKKFMVRGFPKVGDILLTTEAPLGMVCRLDRDDVAIAQRLLTLRGKKGVLNNDYLLYYLQSPIGQYLLRSRETGTTVTGIKQSEFRKIEMDLPDIKYQEKVASILRSIDEKINLNNKINDNLEQEAQVIYNTIVKNSINKKTLSDFIKIKHGYAFKGDFISSDDNGVVLVTPGNFCIGGGFKEIKCKFFTNDYPNDYVLKPNSLIVTMTDLSKEADTLGYGALVPYSTQRIYLHNQRIGLVEQISNELPISYIYWYMRSYEYHMCIVGSSSGSTVKHTSPGRILEQTIPIPTITDRTEYIPVLDEINAIISKNHTENIHLQSLRDTLIPKLISGDIDISNIDI